MDKTLLELMDQKSDTDSNEVSDFSVISSTEQNKI